MGQEVGAWEAWPKKMTHLPVTSRLRCPRATGVPVSRFALGDLPGVLGDICDDFLPLPASGSPPLLPAKLYRVAMAASDLLRRAVFQKARSAAAGPTVPAD